MIRLQPFLKPYLFINCPDVLNTAAKAILSERKSQYGTLLLKTLPGLPRALGGKPKFL